MQLYSILWPVLSRFCSLFGSLELSGSRCLSAALLGLQWLSHQLSLDLYWLSQCNHNSPFSHCSQCSHWHLSHCSQKSVSQLVSDWHGHLLSCPGQLKMEQMKMVCMFYHSRYDWQRLDPQSGQWDYKLTKECSEFYFRTLWTIWKYT